MSRAGMNDRRRRLQRLGLGSAALSGALLLATAAAQTPEAREDSVGVAASPAAATPDLAIVDASVRHLSDFDLLLFEINVEGTAGATTPAPQGALDGAPVLGYVVPTSLAPEAVGFAGEEGIVALAVTSHPDFDDTPLWDESLDGDYTNDGELWHAHWVLVGQDERVPGGLAVLEVTEGSGAPGVPPTAPDLPLYLDSPGFAVQVQADQIRVIVPAPRIAATPDFSFDAASAYLQVNTSDPIRPLLGVYDVYGVLSGDLSLPFQITPE